MSQKVDANGPRLRLVRPPEVSSSVTIETNADYQIRAITETDRHGKTTRTETPAVRMHVDKIKMTGVKPLPPSKSEQKPDNRASSSLPSESTAISSPQTPQENLSATDPRWVFAVRTSQILEGAVLPYAKREQLMKVGSLLGLNRFECNLLIAIVQDHARRGLNIGAARELIKRVPVRNKNRSKPITMWKAALWAGAILVTEIVTAVLWLST